MFADLEDCISIRDGRLFIDDLDTNELADRFGTPLFVLSETQLRMNVRRFRAAFAAHWIDVQREEFKRLGVTGDWDNPYLTMNFRAEALIANELLKFAESGQLYRGSKPVMWSVVEKTALAEAEVEYQDYQSDTIFVKFPVRIKCATLSWNTLAQNLDETLAG